jgi:hypothetical protein
MKRSLKRNIEYRFKEIFGGEYYMSPEDIKKESYKDPHMSLDDGLTIIFMGKIRLWIEFKKYHIRKWFNLKHYDLKLYLLKIMKEKKKLYVVIPNNKPTRETDYIRYKYSDDLFKWFYKRLKYYGFNTEKWTPCIIHKRFTRKDNSRNGCRIFFPDGSYVKFYEVYFLMEFKNKEWEKILEITKNNHVSMEDIINYYYLYN